MSIRFAWLPLTSTSRPIVRGRSVSRVKYLMVLRLAVFENGEIVLFEVGDQAAVLVANARPER